jgi:hypothetical protein
MVRAMEAIVYLMVRVATVSGGGQSVSIPLAFAIAVAGGSIGTLLTLLSGVPEPIWHHDRQISDVDADLAQWVADAMVPLERAAKGALRQGSAAMARSEAATCGVEGQDVSRCDAGGR